VTGSFVVRAMNHVPGSVAGRFTPNRRAARIAKRALDPLLPSTVSEVRVRAGFAAGMRLFIHPRSEKYYWTGAYERAVQQCLRSSLRPGDVVWDIGAHAGFFTAIASLLVGETGAVHAFEPFPANAERLAQTIHANRLRNVELHRVAVGAAAGSAPLYTHGSSSTPSLTPHPGWSSMQVEVVTLDDLLSDLGPPSLVKVDVEGAELECLGGGRRLIAEHQPTVLAEVHDGASLREVLPGYELIQLSKVHFACSAAARSRSSP
jgi:FkbM family methyltransferase